MLPLAGRRRAYAKLMRFGARRITRGTARWHTIIQCRGARRDAAAAAADAGDAALDGRSGNDVGRMT